MDNSHPRRKVEPRFDPAQLAKETGSNRNVEHPGMRVASLLMLPMRGLRGLFSTDDGKPIRPVEARQRLFKMKAKGIGWLSIGPKCEGWSDQTGCPHEQTNQGGSNGKAEEHG